MTDPDGFYLSAGCPEKYHADPECYQLQKGSEIEGPKARSKLPPRLGPCGLCVLEEDNAGPRTNPHERRLLLEETSADEVGGVGR